MVSRKKRNTLKKSLVKFITEKKIVLSFHNPQSLMMINYLTFFFLEVKLEKIYAKHES